MTSLPKPAIKLSKSKKVVAGTSSKFSHIRVLYSNFEIVNQPMTTANKIVDDPQTPDHSSMMKSLNRRLIVGGVPAVLGDFPFSTVSDGNPCGGTLFTRTWPWLQHIAMDGRFLVTAA
jgi:hypothetical protein